MVTISNKNLTALDTAADATDTRYDGISLVLHWSTAVLVFLLFGLEEIKGFFRPERHLLDKVHISFGLLLMAILAIRIFWRLTSGRKVRDAGTGIMKHTAEAAHCLLYVLLSAQAVLGVVTCWFDNETLTFFGLVIPSPFGPFSKATGHFVENIHDIVAWIFMALVGGHALAALFHHFIVRDDTLTRMLPLPLKQAEKE